MNSSYTEREYKILVWPRGVHTVASVMTKPAEFEHRWMSWSIEIIFLTRDTGIVR